MDLEKISYQDLLNHIDQLRSQNKTDEHPEMLAAKWKLRDFLQKRSKSTGIVPRLKTVKTVTLSEAETTTAYNKFAVAGMVLVSVGLIFKMLKS